MTFAVNAALGRAGVASQRRQRCLPIVGISSHTRSMDESGRATWQRCHEEP